MTDSQRLSQAITRGLAFLESKQFSDGSFASSAGMLPSRSAVLIGGIPVYARTLGSTTTDAFFICESLNRAAPQHPASTRLRGWCLAQLRDGWHAGSEAARYTHVCSDLDDSSLLAMIRGDRPAALKLIDALHAIQRPDGWIGLWLFGLFPFEDERAFIESERVVDRAINITGLRLFHTFGQANPALAANIRGYFSSGAYLDDEKTYYRFPELIADFLALAVEAEAEAPLGYSLADVLDQAVGALAVPGAARAIGDLRTAALLNAVLLAPTRRRDAERALASALLEQQYHDGGWGCWPLFTLIHRHDQGYGSRAMTTAKALEALWRYQQRQANTP